jgi:hypothetical protein
VQFSLRAAPAGGPRGGPGLGLAVGVLAGRTWPLGIVGELQAASGAVSGRGRPAAMSGVRPPQRKIQAVDLTPQQYAELVQTAGRPAKELLDRLVASPRWAELPDPMKSKVIEDVIAKTRRAAEEEFLARHPDVLKQSVWLRTQQLGLPAQP